LLQFEGQFLQGKFMWAFLGAKDFSLGQDGQTLTIDGYNSVRPVVFDCQNGSIRLTVNGDAPADLNAVAVTVGGLLLRDLPATAGQPEGVGISFVLKTLDSRGRLTGQNFSFTEYLKQ
jgi:hypothetical protein